MDTGSGTEVPLDARRFDLEVSVTRADLSVGRDIRLEVSGRTADELRVSLEKMAEAVGVLSLGGVFTTAVSYPGEPRIPVEPDDARFEEFCEEVSRAAIAALVAEDGGTTVYSIRTGRIDGWSLEEALRSANEESRAVAPVMERLSRISESERSIAEYYGSVSDLVSVAEVELLRDAFAAVSRVAGFLHVEHVREAPTVPPERAMLRDVARRLGGDIGEYPSGGVDAAGLSARLNEVMRVYDLASSPAYAADLGIPDGTAATPSVKADEVAG